MFIKSISVEGIGRFVTTARVEGFSNGVNVLAAGNEAGKSTLFRAIRTCLFCRHDSKGQEIRDLCSDDSQLPGTIEITFEQDGRTYTIKKCFMRSPSAVLLENGREIARSKQADDTVWQLLGISPGSGRTLDEGAFGLLWVGQGASFGAPEPGPSASSALNAAIESEVGALIGGERARQTVDEIATELRRSLTEHDRPKSDGPLHRALREAEHWRNEEAEARNKLSTLERQFAALLQLREQHREFNDPATANQIGTELVEAKASLEAARSAALEIRRLEAEESGAKRALDQAAHRLKQQRDIAARIDANRQSETEFAKELPEQQGREQEARAALARADDQIAETHKQASALSSQEQQLEKLASAAVRAQRKDDLKRQLKGLEQAAKELTRIDADLAQIVVKAKHIETLDELDRQIDTLDAQLSAAAAQLAVEIKPAGAGQVRIGALRLKDAHTAPILALTKISVGDLAVITMTPAPNTRHDKRQAADAERSALLTSLGVPTSAQARAMLTKRRDLEAERKGVTAELRTHKVTGDPAQVIADTKSELAEIEAAIAAALSDAQRDRLPATMEIEAEKLALGRKRAPLEARRASLQETRKEQQEALEDAVAARSAAGSKLELLRKAIAEDVALYPDSERSVRDTTLVTELAAAEAAHQSATTLLSVKRQTAPDASEIERLEARCQRLDQALKNRNTELIDLEREIGRLTGQIQTAGGDGVGEALAVAVEQRALAERQLARAEGRIATLTLLRDTISSCLTEGLERYYEPVRRHLRPYLNDLFPGAELELGEGFAIAGIRRDRTESFTRLSDGTQEQIAVLVRLAMASMLAERGQTVPVILDDALVYCDDDRIKRMFDALGRAGKRQQVIVLTCRLRTFAPLGGHTLRVQSSAEAG
jgi:hypothetical protein